MSEDNLSNLINNFKNILNNSDNQKKQSSTPSDTPASSECVSNNYGLNENSSGQNNNNLNISPEMINNIANMLKNSNLNTSFNSQSTNTPSNSNENFNVQDGNVNNNDMNYNSNSSLDFETIMKIKSIMETLNKKNDPRSNLLYSLKPYLRKSRQEKLDQYANLFKITQVADIFNFKKGDNK